MEKDNSSDDAFDLEWMGDFEELKINENSLLRDLFEYRDRDSFRQNILKSSTSMQKHPLKSPQKLLLQPFEPQTIITKSSQPQLSKHHIKAQQPQPNHPRNPKDFLYSRAYRQRRRQKYKTIEQENTYLKKRISQLQFQLREQEIELSRIRFQPPEKDVTLSELDRDFISGTMSYVDKVMSDPEEKPKQVYTPQDCYYQGFIDSYNERGFAGKKKMKILNYHFNQLLQALLRDSQKYLSLMFENSKSYEQLTLLPQFEAINNVYIDAYKPQGDLWHRLKEFNQFLKPMTLQLNTLISQFYKKYEEILSCCERIHNFLRETYLRNMDVAFRRVEMQRWFDFNKYGKLMRRLRNRWFEWMKTLAGKQEQQVEKPVKRGSKKKKVSSSTQQ